jgi:hypothetical protein
VVWPTVSAPQIPIPEQANILPCAQGGKENMTLLHSVKDLSQLLGLGLSVPRSALSLPVSVSWSNSLSILLQSEQ